MKPGKPLTFADIVPESPHNLMAKKILAFGLPGNPVSCIVAFQVFVIPTIRQLAGWANPHLPRLFEIIKELLVCVSVLLWGANLLDTFFLSLLIHLP